jgi:Tol biopolymer transport system component
MRMRPFLLIFISVCALHSTATQTLGQGARIAIEAAPVWFEESGSAARISPDGSRAIWASFVGANSARIIDLHTGREMHEAIWPGLDVVSGIAFGAGGQILLRGRRGDVRGWFTNSVTGPALLPLPADADAEWSGRDAQIAFRRRSAPDSGVYIGSPGAVRRFPVPGIVTGLNWIRATESVLVLTADTSGMSSLYRVDASSGQVALIARDLDAQAPTSPFAASADGRHAYISLASSGRPSNLSRNQPFARRRLGIYEVDLRSGVRRAVVSDAAADLLAPAIANVDLYWTRAETRASVVVIPLAGGTTRTVMKSAETPSWRPDGKQIGFYFGDWRVADWAINWDAGVVNVDAAGKPTSRLIPLITNFGEDFPPAWSPNGKWIAYHSHRSRDAVPYYGASTSTDDIWLRRTGRPPRDTADIRLTDFGWEAGPASWSRDGTRLLFQSFDRKGQPGVSILWMTTIDTLTGHALSHARVKLPDGVSSVAWAAWSPTSDDIAIEAEGSPPQHALWIMQSDGSSSRKIAEYPMLTYGGVSWTRDGKSIIYSALVGKHAQLFVVPAVGGQPRQLTHDSASLLHPSVSPDGRLVAATRLEHDKSIVHTPLPQ